MDPPPVYGSLRTDGRLAEQPPRVVSGERLMLGDLRSTPVQRVSFLPGP